MATSEREHPVRGSYFGCAILGVLGRALRSMAVQRRKDLNIKDIYDAFIGVCGLAFLLIWISAAKESRRME